MTTESTVAYWLSPQQERAGKAQQAGYCGDAVAVVQLRGPLVVSRLRDAVSALVAKREILRTVYRKAAGMKTPFQVVLDGAQMQEFRWDRGPVLSLQLEALEGGDHELSLRLPAMCADRRALKILVKELGTLYGGGEIGEEPLSYRQFAQWQKELLASEDDDAREARAYWERMTVDASTPLAWPEMNPEAGAFEAKSIAFAAGLAMMAKLDALAKATGTAASIILLAAWKSLVWRITGLERIDTAVECEGRQYEELESLIGRIAKAVPVALSFAGDLQFREVAGAVQQALMAAEEKQEHFAPPGGAVSELGFEYVDSDEGATFGDVRFRLQRAEAEAEPYTLKLEVERTPEGTRLVFHYDASRLGRRPVERWSGHFMRLLEAALERPSEKVNRLPLLLAPEREQLLVDWNRTQGQYPRDRKMHELIREQAERTPERAAVRSGERVLSYRELNEQAGQLAEKLRQAGVESGSLVALMGQRSPEMLVGVLGIWKASCAYVPVASDHPAARLAEQMRGVAAVVRVEGGKTSAGMSGDRPVAHASGSFRLSCGTGEEGLAYVIYTSGSTGVPKGVAVTHRNLINYACAIQKRLELERFPEGLQFATVSALQADLGHTAIFPALVSGGTVHVIPQDVATDSKALGEYFERYRIDVLKIVPSHMRALLEGDGGGRVLPRKYLILGGEALTRALVERIEALHCECELVNHYGPTETTVGSLTLRLSEYDWRSSPARTIPIGRPIANTQVYILDAHMEPVPIGVAGELYISGDGVSKGYLNQPEQTSERFIPNPFGEGLCYRTGDLARYLEDGLIEFLGRADEQVKIRGYRIEPGEVEAVLLRHAQVEQAAVVPRVDQRGDLQLVAYVVLRPQGTVTSEELERHLRGVLPEYMIPSAVVGLQKLPLNANGKLDRKALPSPDAVEQKVYEAPATPTEVALAAIWAEVLKRGSIGRNDHFFHLGGHSLLATQVVSRVRERLRVEAPMRILFDRPVLSELASWIESFGATNYAEEEELDEIVPVSRAGYRR